MAQRNFTPSQPTITSRTVRINTGSIGPKPAQPKSRSNFDDQGSVNNVFGWLKANWSKPLLSPSELQSQRDLYDKQNKKPLKEQIFKKYNQ